MLPVIRGWTDAQRTPQANLKLGATLAFVAGATNAGGFLAVGQYTSHMTGVLSSVADHLALGHWLLAGAALAAFASFMAGAMCTAILVNWGQRRQLHSCYSLPLLIEAAFLMLFGLMGASSGCIPRCCASHGAAAVFHQGLQNAVIPRSRVPRFAPRT